MDFGGPNRRYEDGVLVRKEKVGKLDAKRGAGKMIERHHKRGGEKLGIMYLFAKG